MAPFFSLGRANALLACVCLFGCWLIPRHADAQLNRGNLWPLPRLLTVAPAGGKVGTTFDVECGGTDINGAEALLFSHPGIKATLLPPPAEPKDPKAKRKAKAPPPPRFSITLAKDVPLGLHDVRLVTRLGVSNPRAFHVGTLDVVREKEPNDDVDKAQKVEIGTTIFGVISGNTDVDYYTFAGKKGQRLVISCLTISIDSRLYPEIRVFDSEQRQIAFHRPLPGSDAVTSVTLPANGNYFIRINQFTYNAGGPDHFYLLSLSTGPWIDAVFPPVVEPGRTTQLALVGRNLPDGKIDPRAVIDGKTLEKCTVVVSAPADAQSLTRLAFSGAITPPQGLLDGFEYRLRTPTGVSNPVLLTFARDPLYLDYLTPETEQQIKVPCEVAGRIDKQGF